MKSKPISLDRIKVKDQFWQKEIELARTEVIPYQWEALNDRIPGATPSFCMRNFKLAGKIIAERKAQGENYIPKIWPLEWESLPQDMDHLEDRFYGWLFQDTDFSKWIEAVAYSLAVHPDPELEKTADEAIEIVCAAQLENGYLDTFYIINDISKIFTNLRDNHELYCFGHLTEGAVAYYQATGKDKLLKSAMRFADYIEGYFGPEEGKCKGYPGHEVAEMALARLYELTGEKRYLNLGRFFIEQRGTRPYYFDIEHPEMVKPGQEAELRHVYHQAHLPVREQKEAVGHSVRAVYLYSGMADIARLTGDESLLSACEVIWNNIVNQKMYITGGIGATHMGEAFSFPYDLPNDTAYAETCAAIGLIFFAHRMLSIRLDSKYADVMEKALYNGVLSGMALDGKSFFYVNPLEVLPEACHIDERKFHVKPVRRKWFGCSCCPPNIARLVTSIASYAYGENDDTLFVHLYICGEVKAEFGGVPISIDLVSNFPWEGSVTAKVQTEGAAEFSFAFRIPDWCDGNYSLKKDKLPENCSDYLSKGYLYLHGLWQDGDTVEIDFPMVARAFMSHQRVRENIGKAAIMRGPLVYCLEEIDNGPDLHMSALASEALSELEAYSGDICRQEMIFIKAKGKRRCEDTGTKLYLNYEPPKYQDVMLNFVPYFAWSNRGEGEMRVWVQI